MLLDLLLELLLQLAPEWVPGLLLLQLLLVLALSFLLLIGVRLVAEGFDAHISTGYIYFAMAFALAVEMVNYRADSKAKRAAEAALRRNQPDRSAS